MTFCSGCLAGYPITKKDGIHRYPNGTPFMVCESHRYEGLTIGRKTGKIRVEPSCSCDQRGRTVTCDRCKP